MLTFSPKLVDLYMWSCG
uniref:Uncharacterized protein n=1 Tax=Arundo donax TaxID=35708 RepID=A0A0A8YK38_ARUDO